MTRRQALLSGSAAAALALWIGAAPAHAANNCGLDDITLGQGRWTTQNKALPTADMNSVVPATFCTYASRLLIRYDEGVSNWWSDVQRSYGLLPHDQKQVKLSKNFGFLARSIQLALDRFLLSDVLSPPKNRYEDLADLFVTTYGSSDQETQRHIAILFSMLPRGDQPTLALTRLSTQQSFSQQELAMELLTRLPDPTPQILRDDLTALLPDNFHSIRVKGSTAYTIFPPLSLYEVGIDEEFGQTAITTVAGPLAASPLKRELPEFTTAMYGLFGISGATSCALTHTAVIPLDVVKTRMQTDPGQAKNIFDGAAKIIEKEGLQGLLLGSQATIVAYTWYGVSVYPSYTFFKRYLSHALSPDMATIHTNDIALIAGAMAAVIASLGLTPMEACRIRTVAEPAIYKPKGLLGTIKAISSEDTTRGWTTLYAGLPSLLTRQVIFGSIKFLAFERACEAIFHAWPFLHDATWTSLGVSLVAGGLSGVVSSVMSQPADSVLTYVAQNKGTGQSSMGVLEGSRLMIEQEGSGSLFRGLGSRCVWAGSIIGGQFLLYDIFRTYFGVNGEDLAQIYELVIPSTTFP
jgi:solute carrier family 25 (mitochondrial phosphate transporter), member 3